MILGAFKYPDGFRRRHYNLKQTKIMSGYNKAQMLQMLPSQIRQLFKGLPLIVHKKVYLIPQAPSPPQSLGLRLNIFVASLNKNKGRETRQQMNATLKSIRQRQHEAIAAIKKAYMQDLAAYRLKQQKYKATYIEPVNICQKYKLYPFFLRTQFQIAKENNIQNLTVKDVAEKWKSLTQEQVDQYARQCEAERHKLMDVLMEYQSKHRIPEVKRSKAYAIYRRMNGSEGKMFSELSQDEKQKYCALAEQQHQQQKEKLRLFLQRWNITEQDLDEIIQVSAIYEWSKKQRANKSKNSKQQQTEDDAQLQSPENQE